MIPGIIALAVFAALIAGRRRAATLDRQVLARFSRGPDGVIVGAEPISLEGRGDRAVLLVHGCGDTPQSLSRLATTLHQRGYTVLVPLLPGHGRSLRDLSQHSAEEWYATVKSAFTSLRNAHSRVGVVGLSMGGALSARLAEEIPEIPALVLLSPYFGMPTMGDLLTRTSAFWGLFAPSVSTAAEGSVLDPKARAAGLAYGAMTARALRELRRVALCGRRSLPGVMAPTLVIQSRTDNRISGALTQKAFEEIGAAEKRIEWIEGAGHVITVDFGWERVAASTGEWLDAHVGAGHTAPVDS